MSNFTKTSMPTLRDKFIEDLGKSKIIWDSAEKIAYKKGYADGYKDGLKEGVEK